MLFFSVSSCQYRCLPEVLKLLSLCILDEVFRNFYFFIFVFIFFATAAVVVGVVVVVVVVVVYLNLDSRL
jgi:uncharacterized membrane protein